MILSGITRSFFRRSSFETHFLKRALNKKHSVRNLYVSGIVSNKEEHIYKSPYTAVDIPNVSLLEYLRQKTHNYDDRVALVCGETGDVLRYGEVWEKVRSVASALARLGVERGSTVALVTPNCPEFVIALFGAMATGSTVTTVNSLYTAEEIARQLQDSGASVVLYHPTTAAAVYEATQRLPSTTKKPHRISTHQTTNEGDLSLQELCRDDGQAYPKDLKVDICSDVLVLPYSSGTTGLPKGVMLTNRNLVANLQQISHPDLVFSNPDGVSVLFAVLPMFHMYGMVACLFLSFTTASKCVTFTKFDPQLYVKSMTVYRPTVMHIVPPIVHFLVQSSQVLPEYFASINRMVCAAAPVGEALVKQVHDKFGHGIEFQEGYGMTELSPLCHMTSGSNFVAGSCGPPISNTLAKLVDTETGENLPPGNEKGELCVKGEQVMKGYYNNPEATASTIDSDGWLHTGDIARVDGRGNFYIVDRLKELIKVKGFQVAPAELENLLRGCEGVQDVAVIGVPDDMAGELPMAYVVKDVGHESLTAEAVQSFVSKRVTAHKKLAGGVVFLDAIPKSMTGKILRKDLKELAIKK